MATPFSSVPQPNESHLGRGYGTGGNVSDATDFANGNAPTDSSPLAQSLGQQSFGGQHREDFDASQRDSSVVDDSPAVRRSASTASTAVNNKNNNNNSNDNNNTPSRNNTLRKRSSVRRTGSLKRSGSRKSLRAGSIKGLAFGDGDAEQEFNSAFHTPIPTSGTPTEVLADRFQAWRQLLKSLIAYFREIQVSYETRAKALHKLQNTVSNIANPSVFMSDRGLGEATRILDDYHKHSIAEANKSRDIEDDVIAALTGLRSDLGQKIKEIKSLSGDFKNSVEREKETTRREVEKLQTAIQHADHEDSANGKTDPFVVRLGVDRTVEKQIDEENYLHRAYLNLESSGRELESIIVGEIQKAYKALAGILRREGDDAYNAVENLRSGPISMPKEQEWTQFVTNDPHFVAPNIPLRRIEDITYPGKDHPAAAEIRAGMLERKSKYLKSYTPGWYVLSSTHLHEFKSADKIYTQPPVMSLYLADQRLGSHSEAGSSSHKFMLKGRQSGGMHRGHNWVFRAESHDTMLAWFNDIKTLTEKPLEERNAFVRKHTRSLSGTSDRPRSYSSDGLDDDDADAVPYSADAASLAEQTPAEQRPQRPQPGGRFPSDLQIPRNAPLSPSSGSSGIETNRDYVAPKPAVAPGVVTSPIEEYERTGANPYKLEGVPTVNRNVQEERDNRTGGTQPSPVQRSAPNEALATQSYALPIHTSQQHQALNQQQAPTIDAQHQNQPFLDHRPAEQVTPLNNRSDGDWIAPAAAGVGIGALGTEAYRQNQKQIPDSEHQSETDKAPVVPDKSAKRLSLLDDAAVDDTHRGSRSAIPVAAPVVTGESDTDKHVVSSPDTPTPAEPVSPIAVPVAAGVSQSSNADPLVATSAVSAGGTTTTTTTTTTTSSSRSPAPLGGLEKEGAHETGQLFPRVLRHDTDISVTKLHVPGEFPRKA